jgi:hypothetical protein
MTAAVGYICKKTPADRDSNELGKRIVDEINKFLRTPGRAHDEGS